MTIVVPPSSLAAMGPAQKRANGGLDPHLERARGAVGLTVARRDGRNVIADLSQAGCGRLLFPRIPPGAPLEAVLVNTSGGLTGGDRFATRIIVEAGAEAVLTTQACEKIYRADGSAASVATTIVVSEDAGLAWLPQETILFNRSRLNRSLDAELAANSRLLVAEAVLLGRKASGEALAEGLFRDRWRIRRAGRLVFAEAMRLEDDIAAAIARPATLAGAAAFATLLYVGPDAAERAEQGRALMNNAAVKAGISPFDGLCVARLVAQDGAPLRAALIALLRIFGTAVPRVWSL